MTNREGVQEGVGKREMGRGGVRTTHTHTHTAGAMSFIKERNCQHKTLTRVFPVEMFAINSQTVKPEAKHFVAINNATAAAWDNATPALLVNIN